MSGLKIHGTSDRALGCQTWQMPRKANFPSSSISIVNVMVSNKDFRWETNSCIRLLDAELDFLKDIFRRHGFGLNEIHRVIPKKRDAVVKQDKEEDVIKGVAIIPVCGSVTNHITCILQRQNIKTDQTP